MPHSPKHHMTNNTHNDEVVSLGRYIFRDSHYWDLAALNNHRAVCGGLQQQWHLVAWQPNKHLAPVHTITDSVCMDGLLYSLLYSVSQCAVLCVCVCVNSETAQLPLTDLDKVWVLQHTH